jgi:hypothetical protein
MPHSSIRARQLRPYPWIALYSDRLSRLLTAFSLLLAPVTGYAMLLRAVEAGGSIAVNVVLGLTVALSTTIAFLCWQRIEVLRRK